ncbi:MAG TPA: SpoIVB peptidase S55 domain-containing protein [Candidatus Eisenbacteria bacterium]|nr:SpoIVB peptidase S55 domain-containing protein [Candidatus Eisenbacteria bacterium]
MAASARPLPAVFPVDSLKAGMTGYGLTVFQGTKIDTFQVTILGVLRGYRPGANLILARTAGHDLERTGIIAGMSGSPVYIHGKLLGAIAYAWAFNKDPVGGITPVEEMMSLFPPDGTPPPDDVDRRIGIADFGTDGDAKDVPAPGTNPLDDPTGVRAIATPLTLSGFTPEAVDFLQPWLEKRGFVVSPGGGFEPGVVCDSLVPGSAVGVELIRGDWSAAAIGTLTYRDGNRLLAFGHPFVAMGWVRFPLTAATIHTIFASQQISTKVGSPSTTCGTLVADRSIGVSGELGAPPAMIPVHVAIQGSGKRDKRYNFEVVRNRLLTPSLVGSAVVNSISEALNDAGFATIDYDLTFYMNAGARTVRKGNVFLTQSPITGVGEEVSQSLQLLMSDHFRPSTLDSARIDIRSTVGLEAARISDVRVRPASAAPGDSVEVEITLRRGGAMKETRRTRLYIPPQTPEGELSVRVADGDETDRWERERTPDRYQPDTFDQLVQVIESERRLDRIYVQLYRQAGGATVRGGEISQPPASVLGVLTADRKSGAVAPTKGATLSEKQIPMDVVVRGSETAKLDVVPDLSR